MTELSRESIPPQISVVVPIYNKVHVLRESLDSIIAAARELGSVELLFVDHSSTDGSSEVVREYAAVARIEQRRGGTISSVRNFGAGLARAAVLSFVDCDCVVRPTYFRDVLTVLEEADAAAVGCEYEIPTEPHWTEFTWYHLQSVHADGYRRYVNSGNFAVRREAFDAIRGFDERLEAGEDTDICSRLWLAGFRIFESRRLSVVHLGNPKSVREFFRKQRWQGLGIFRGRISLRRDRVSLLVLAHLVVVTTALATLLAPIHLALRVPVALLLTTAVPLSTVIYRFIVTRRVTHPGRALLLYIVWYFARAQALLIVMKRRWRRLLYRREVVAAHQS